jgi:hypothetical protein
VRIAKSLVVSIAAVVLPILPASPASALSSAPDAETWGFNGRVSAIHRSGGTVYVGGEFTQIISPNGATQAANHLAAFDAFTLQPTSWRPSVDGDVLALASSGDGSTIYIGGDFASVQNSSRANVAAVSSSGALLPWKSNANGSVRAFVVSGSTVYMGGAFRKVQTVNRLGLAAINGTNGTLLPWSPSVTIHGTTTVPIVRGLALANGDVVAVGKFSSANGPGEAPQPEPNQARFDATSGARKPWADNYANLSYGVVSDGTDYYVAAGGPGGSILRYGPTGGQTWRVSTDGDVQAIGLFEGKVIAGGHFVTTSGKDIPRLAALSAAGALDTSWRPNPNGTDSGTWAIAGTGAGRLYVGGGFSAVGGNGALRKFAQFAGGSTPPVDSEPPTAPANVVADAVAANRVDLRWTASTDDVGVTAYDIHRNGAAAPLATVSPTACAGSACAFTDTTVAPSTAYAYVVRARDAAGYTSDPSNEATATTPAAGGMPTIVRVVADADAMVKEGSPGTNYGANTALRVDAGADPDVESYLRFSVSGLSGGPVQDARLRLWATSATTNGPAAYSTATAWTEAGTGGITWSTRPARTSPATDDKASVSAGTWVEFDVTSLVTGNGTFSFVLAGTSTDGLDLSSREGVNAPELVVTG